MQILGRVITTKGYAMETIKNPDIEVGLDGVHNGCISFGFYVPDCNGVDVILSLDKAVSFVNMLHEAIAKCKIEKA